MAVLCVIRVSDTLRLLHVVVVGYHNILTETAEARFNVHLPPAPMQVYLR